MTDRPDPAPFTPPALADLFRTPSPRKAPTMHTLARLTFHGGPPLAVCRRHPVPPLEVHLATHDNARIAKISCHHIRLIPSLFGPTEHGMPVRNY